MDAIDRASERIETERAKHESELQKYVHQLDDAEAKIKARYAALDAKMRAKAEQHGNPDASGDDVIKINAGGKLIDVRREKLCQIENTGLAALFGGRWDDLWPRDAAGRIFLDVNPACFQALVDYLNELAISSADNMPKGPSVDEDEDSMRQMLYMFGLCEFVGMHPQLDSDIINTESKEETLYNWLHEEGQDGHLRLLYRLTRDINSPDPDNPRAGMMQGPHTFHSKCDNQGATVALFKIFGECVVGGYSSVPWTDETEYSADDKAFIFFMAGGGLWGTTRRKMKLKDPNDPQAVLGQESYGPCFGDDLTAINAQPHFYLYFSPGRRYEASGNENIDNIDNNGYSVEQMEVFQMVRKDHGVAGTIAIDGVGGRTTSFSKGMNNALNAKYFALQMAELEIGSRERDFTEEERFVKFLGVDANDIIELNVSGTIMTTRRSTLQFCNDCTLARQFDPVWDETRASQEGATLIEHSPYCFGKILDFLRLKHLYAQELCEYPWRPRVQEKDRERFEKIVDYYFPGDASKYVLG